jgi:hypothetical protein
LMQLGQDRPIGFLEKPRAFLERQELMMGGCK